MIGDTKLVIKAKRGERAAFDELMRRHYDLARRIALGFAPIPEDADDLVQEAFVTAYVRLHQLKDPECFGPWLAAIVRNEGRMWYRRRSVQPVLLALDGDEPGDPSPIEHASVRTARESVVRDSVREAIADAISVLCSQQRQVVRLHYLEGYDYTETASLLNVPIAAVRGRLDRARDVLRRELSEMVISKAWGLGGRDLDAIRAAATVASSDPDRQVLNAILFTGKGQIVSTDTHRLFVCKRESFAEMPRALISAQLGRELRDTYADARNARLCIEENEAMLRLAEGWEMRAPLIDEVYPDWEKIVPAEWMSRAIAKCGDWLQSLALLSRHNGNETDNVLPRVLVVISPVDQRITLRQDHQAASAAPGEIAHEVSVWFPARFEQGEQDLIMAMNPVYLEQSIRFLALEPDAEVELCANSHYNPILTRSVGEGDTFIVTMPMRRVDRPRSGGDVR